MPPTVCQEQQQRLHHSGPQEVQFKLRFKKFVYPRNYTAAYSTKLKTTFFYLFSLQLSISVDIIYLLNSFDLQINFRLNDLRIFLKVFMDFHDFLSDQEILLSRAHLLMIYKNIL